MQSRMEMKLVLDAVLMTVWRRRARSKTIIHSDQGSQFTSYEWQSFFQCNNGLLSPIDFEKQQKWT